MTAWYVLSVPEFDGSATEPLPAGAPTAAQYLLAVMPHLAPCVRADIEAGRVGARRVRIALSQVADVLPVHIMPSRSEVERARRYLVREGRIRDAAVRP